MTMSHMIETERLKITEVQAEDASDFFDYMSREEYVRFVPMEIPTMEGIEIHIKRSLAQQSEIPRLGFFLAVRLKENSKVIGEASLRITNQQNREAEIGWAIHSDCTGKGLATEVGRGLLFYGFLELKLHRIFARCHPSNLASIRIMEKLDFKTDGGAGLRRVRFHQFTGTGWSVNTVLKKVSLQRIIG